MSILLKVKQQIGRWFFDDRFEAKKRSFQSLFPKDVEITRVASGFQFTEGPVWLAESADWQSLYVTARTSVYQIRVNIPGIALP